jgi:hypothetical protein
VRGRSSAPAVQPCRTTHQAHRSLLPAIRGADGRGGSSRWPGRPRECRRAGRRASPHECGGRARVSVGSRPPPFAGCSHARRGSSHLGAAGLHLIPEWATASTLGQYAGVAKGADAIGAHAPSTEDRCRQKPERPRKRMPALSRSECARCARSWAAGRDADAALIDHGPSFRMRCQRAFAVPPVRSRASRVAISSLPSAKSKICPFERIRSRRLDFGITTAPC